TTSAGYAGGYTPHPTYEEIFSARTGHAEAVRVIYTGGDATLRALLTQFWQQHDPTTAMRQGNDVGTEYRSAVYWTTPEQGEVVRESVTRYQQALDAAGRGRITTELAPLSEAGAGVYYTAEPEHQQILAKNPDGYCTHGFNGVTCPPEPAAQAGAAASRRSGLRSPRPATASTPRPTRSISSSWPRIPTGTATTGSTAWPAPSSRRRRTICPARNRCCGPSERARGQVSGPGAE